MEEQDLPRAHIKRIVKSKLSELGGGKDVQVNKDALLAFSEGAKIFIHYLAATSNDLCQESKRQTISADDVLKAIKELDFPEFAEPLEAALDAFKKEAKEKSQKKSETSKKRKAQAAVEEAGGEGEGGGLPVGVNLESAMAAAEEAPPPAEAVVGVEGFGGQM